MSWSGNNFARIYSWVADATASPPVDITASRFDTDTDDIVNSLSVGMKYITLTASGAIPPGIGTVWVNAGSAVALTLPSGPYGSNPVRIMDISGAAATNQITITPAAGLINGAANYVIGQNYGAALLAYDGANWGVSSTFQPQVGILTKAITGDTALTAAEVANVGFVFTGALGGTATITFPAGFVGPAQIENQTTGGFALIVKYAAGTGVTVPVSGAAAVMADGTNFKLQNGVVRTSAGAQVVGDLGVTGDVAVAGDFGVTGVITAAAFNATTGSFSDDVGIVGDFGVTGAATFSTTLHGVGVATFDAAVNVAGNVTSTNVAENRMLLSSATGNAAWYEFDTAGVDRWLVGKDATAEGGADAGSDFSIINNSDAGNPIGTPFHIKRSTGNVTIGNFLLLATHTPSSAGDTGIAGTITWDANFIYICSATNTWLRVAIATW